MSQPPLELSQAQITAIIGAIAAAEIAASRKDDEQYWQQHPWSQSTVLTTKAGATADDEYDQIIVDSLEWMSIAARVAQFFQLDKAGVDDYLLRQKHLGGWAEVVLQSRQLGYQDITFLTSGSTGRPEAHEHRWSALIAETDEHARRLAQMGINVDRLVSVVPPHHIYGFIFSVLLPGRLDCAQLSGFKAFRSVHSRQLEAGDLLVGFPAWYQQLCQQQLLFAAGVNAISSAGALPATTAQQLLSLGLETVQEIYGSTETAGIASRCYFRDTYQLLERWQKHSATALIERASDAVVDLPDQVEWHSERHFTPVARHDQAAKISGYKVYPQRIAELIQQQPMVAAARVRTTADNDATSLKALVVVTDEHRSQSEQALIETLRQELAAKLTAHELPKHFTIADTVPTNSMGKEVDWPTVPSASIATQQPDSHEP